MKFLQITDDLIINPEYLVYIEDNQWINLYDCPLITITQQFTAKQFWEWFTCLNDISAIPSQETTWSEVRESIDSLRTKTKDFVYLSDLNHKIVNIKYVANVYKADDHTDLIFKNSQRLCVYLPYERVIKYIKGDFTQSIEYYLRTTKIEVCLPITHTYTLFNLPNPSTEAKNILANEDISHIVIHFKAADVSNFTPLKYQGISENCDHVWTISEPYRLGWIPHKSYIHYLKCGFIDQQFTAVCGDSIEDSHILARTNHFIVKYHK